MNSIKIIIFCSVLLLLSCSKDGDNSIPVKIFLDPTEIGTYHNYIAKYIVDNSNFDDVYHCGSDIKDVLLTGKSEISAHFGFDEVEYVNILNEIDFSNFKDIYQTEEIDLKSIALESQLSNELIVEINEFESYLYSIDYHAIYNNNPSALVNIIQDKIEKFSSKRKINSDIGNQYKGFIRVVKSSVELWFPRNLGGLGYNEILSAKISNTKIKLRKNWITRWVSSKKFGKFIISDAVGAVAGVATSLVSSGGATAIPNPLLGGIPTAGVVGVISGA